MLENEYKQYGNWDVRQLDARTFLKTIPLCMLLALPVGIWLTDNIILWLLIGALVGIVVGCESLLETRLSQQGQNYIKNNVEDNSKEVISEQVILEQGGAALNKGA